MYTVQLLRSVVADWQLFTESSFSSHGNMQKKNPRVQFAQRMQEHVPVGCKKKRVKEKSIVAKNMYFLSTKSTSTKTTRSQLFLHLFHSRLVIIVQLAGNGVITPLILLLFHCNTVLHISLAVVGASVVALRRVVFCHGRPV